MWLNDNDNVMNVMNVMNDVNDVTDVNVMNDDHVAACVDVLM